MRVDVLLLSLLVVLTPIALADDDEDGRDDDDRDDDDGDGPDEIKRRLEIEVSGSEARIRMARESGASEDSVKIKYDADEGSMKVSYETENETTEIETELKVRFKEIVEFRDADGDAAYDRNETRVARHEIGSLDWRIEGPDDVASSSGAPGKRITGIGDFDEGGSLVFVLYVYGDFANVNGTSLRPTEAKIDIILDRFPYRANDTLVALIVRSEQESEVEVEGEDDGMAATANGFRASFSWADNATVDGVTRPVRTTVLEVEEDDGGSETKFALAYPRGILVNHDPVLGIQSTGETRSIPAAPAASVVVGLAMAAGVATIARRRG